MDINKIYEGDCISVMKSFLDNSIDTIITDPPYGLGFMNKEWDDPKKQQAAIQKEKFRSAERKEQGKSPTVASFSPLMPGLAIKGAKEGRWFQEWSEAWAKEALRVLKPGGTMLVFCAPRMYHRMACGIEDAGFQIRDCIMWVFGSGFPKATDLAKNIKKQFDKWKKEIYDEYEHLCQTLLSNAKIAEKIFSKNIIETGILIPRNDFVAVNVLGKLKEEINLKLNAIIVELNLEEVNLLSKKIEIIVQENVGQNIKPTNLFVNNVEENLEPQTVIDNKNFVQNDVIIYQCERILGRIKEDGVLKTELGKLLFSKKIITDVSCVELIGILKHTILSQSKTFQSCDTKSQMELLTAIDVIITKSTMECLIINMEDMWDKKGREWKAYKSHGLKPAYEPILVAMKPNDGSYAENALKYGVSGLNIDEARIPYEHTYIPAKRGNINSTSEERKYGYKEEVLIGSKDGRFPANIILECICDEVITEPTITKEPQEVSGGIFHKSTGKPADRTYKGGEQIHTNPECPCYILDKQSGNKTGQLAPTTGNEPSSQKQGQIYNDFSGYGKASQPKDNLGGASRFFYVAKASKSERNEGLDGFEEQQVNDGRPIPPDNAFQRGKTERKNNHPTVKPLKLMEYLCILTKTPTGGIVLDPFVGSGSTLIAAKKVGRDYIGIEKEVEYVKIAEARIKAVQRPLNLSTRK